jgi:hypothetical protein
MHSFKIFQPHRTNVSPPLFPLSARWIEPELCERRFQFSDHCQAIVHTRDTIICSCSRTYLLYLARQHRPQEAKEGTKQLPASEFFAVLTGEKKKKTKTRARRTRWGTRTLLTTQQIVLVALHILRVRARPVASVKRGFSAD